MRKKMISIILSVLLLAAPFHSLIASAIEEIGLFSNNITAVELQTTMVSAKEQGVASAKTVTDDFYRIFTRFSPATYYFENGSDLESTIPVSPGGDVDYGKASNEVSRANGEYTVLKVVYRSNEDYIPVLQSYKTLDSSVMVDATYEVAPALNTWNVVYYEIESMRYFRLHYTPDASINHPNGCYDLGYIGIFGDLSSAKAHNSAFEGELNVSKVYLGENSIRYDDLLNIGFDLEGAEDVPKLTVAATGDTSNVEIINGVIDGNGRATSLVKNGREEVVRATFSNGDSTFRITDILVNSESIGCFEKSKKIYDFYLDTGSQKPYVTYTYAGAGKNLTINTTQEENGGKIEKYIVTIEDGEEIMYTINFSLGGDRPKDLANTLYKLKVEKNLTVGYFGGSVTNGTGSTNSSLNSWRAITRDWLSSQFPNATVTERNASIGGTGTLFGVFRIEKQYIKEKAPDLNFIELCLNDSLDGTYNTNKNYIYVESIVNKIYASNKKADIVFVITGGHEYLREDCTSEKPYYGKPYTEIAAHYNIPIVYVGRELIKDIYVECNNSYPSSASNSVWLKYFYDGVHPNDKGYAHYAQTLIDYLSPQLLTGYMPALDTDYTDKYLPEVSFCESNNKGDLMIDANMITPTAFTDKTYLGGYSWTYKWDKNQDMYKFYSSRKGDVVSFKFNSSNIGIWTWSYAEGTELQYSIDGGPIQSVKIQRAYPNHRIYLLAENLDGTEHTIRLYHADSNAALEVCNFLLWGMDDNAQPSMIPVPYLNMNTAEYSVKIGGKVFADFNPSIKEYTVLRTQGYSGELTFECEGYYGYSIISDNNIAKLSIDNVGEYQFNFAIISSSKFAVGTDYISKIPSGTTVKEFLNSITGKECCKVYNGTSEVSESEKITTGMTVKVVVNDEEIKTYLTAVSGDVDGDGIVSQNDINSIKNYVLNKESISGVYLAAADYNCNGTVTVTDFIQSKKRYRES